MKRRKSRDGDASGDVETAAALWNAAKSADVSGNLGAQCPHPIDSPLGRDWIKARSVFERDFANSDPGHPRRVEADERIRSAGLGPLRTGWDSRPSSRPDPADPAYLDHLAAQMARDEAVRRSIERSRFGLPGPDTISDVVRDLEAQIMAALTARSALGLPVRPTFRPVLAGRATAIRTAG